jgi:hypothetical protein
MVARQEDLEEIHYNFGFVYVAVHGASPASVADWKRSCPLSMKAWSRWTPSCSAIYAAMADWV